MNADRVGAHRASPAILSEPSGMLHVAWIEADTGRGDDVRYARRLPGQTTWTVALRVSDGERRGRASPDLAVDASGSVHLVWIEVRDGGSAVMHSMRSPGGTGWQVPRPIRPAPGSSWQWAPVAAADRVGNTHFLWTDAGGGTPDVVHRFRDVDGRWSPVRRVHEETRGDQRDPAVVDTPDGELVAVWQDTRDGTSQIHGGRLPQFGDAWWPDARLSSPLPGMLHRAPCVASDHRGRVVALWIADAPTGQALRYSELHTYDPLRPYWTEDREAYRPVHGEVQGVAAAGGPGASVVAAWSETRPDGARIYAAAMPPGITALAPQRVDASRAVTDGQEPDVALDLEPRAHVVWRGTARAGGDDAVHAASALPALTYPPIVLQGWLQYRPREPNCGTGAYAVVGCDGVAEPPILGGEPSLAAYLGGYVSVRGAAVMDGPCPHISDPVAVFETSPCPRDTGSVTGRVTLAGQAVEAASVSLGLQIAETGPSGRFFLDRVPAGSHPLTATVTCGLAARMPSVAVPRGFLATVASASLSLGDVTGDCRVGLADLVRAAAAYKSPPPHAPPCVDVDRDGAVSMADLSWIAASYGAACPMPWSPPPPAGSAPAVRQAPIPAEPPALWLRGGSRVRAWEVEVALRPAPELPARAAAGAAAPFASELPVSGTWVVENRFDPATGRARFAAVVLGPAPPLSGDRRLALVTGPLAAPSSHWRVVAARLYGDEAAEVPGAVTLEAADAADAAGEAGLWLPWAFTAP